MLEFKIERDTDLINNDENIIIKRLQRQALIFGLFFGLTWVLESVISVSGILDDYFISLKISPFGMGRSILMRLIAIAWLFLNGVKLRLNLLMWLFFAIISPIIAAILISITKFETNDETYEETEV